MQPYAVAIQVTSREDISQEIIYNRLEAGVSGYNVSRSQSHVVHAASTYNFAYSKSSRLPSSFIIDSTTPPETRVVGGPPPVPVIDKYKIAEPVTAAAAPEIKPLSAATQRPKGHKRNRSMGSFIRTWADEVEKSPQTPTSRTPRELVAHHAPKSEPEDRRETFGPVPSVKIVTPDQSETILKNEKPQEEPKRAPSPVLQIAPEVAVAIAVPAVQQKVEIENHSGAEVKLPTSPRDSKKEEFDSASSGEIDLDQLDALLDEVKKTEEMSKAKQEEDKQRQKNEEAARKEKKALDKMKQEIEMKLDSLEPSPEEILDAELEMEQWIANEVGKLDIDTNKEDGGPIKIGRSKTLGKEGDDPSEQASGTTEMELFYLY